MTSATHNPASSSENAGSSKITNAAQPLEKASLEYEQKHEGFRQQIQHIAVEIESLVQGSHAEFKSRCVILESQRKSRIGLINRVREIREKAIQAIYEQDLLQVENDYQV